MQPHTRRSRLLGAGCLLGLAGLVILGTLAGPAAADGVRCRGNDDCPVSEVCFRKTRTCQPACEVRCVDEKPVCGKDGITYPCGKWDALCHGAKVKHRGACKPDEPCACPKLNAPVCGSDGVTYRNRCEARCAGVEPVHPGECTDGCRSPADCAPGEVCHPRTHECQPVCEVQCIVPDPVCGTDGRTYVCGEEDAHCHGVEVAYPGECKSCLCPDVWDPVCGRDNETYGNACEAACAGVPILHEGVCQLCMPPPCACPEIYAPVCGIDGRTYENECKARCAGVHVAHEGPCSRCGPDGIQLADVCTPKCYGDQDCEDGSVCNAATECLPDPACPACAVCVGWCTRP